VCYEYGEGVEKNIHKAIDLYKKAAAQGHAKAKERLQELGRK
jgi:TPR repeat protein